MALRSRSPASVKRWMHFLCSALSSTSPSAKPEIRHALPRTRPGQIRTAELRFGHPFAVVAVATSPQWPGKRHVPGRRLWRGLPVFSGWITQPEEADDAAGPA